MVAELSGAVVTVADSAGVEAVSGAELGPLLGGAVLEDSG